MKNIKYSIIFVIALFGVMLFTACDNNIDMSDTQTLIENGYGRISINLTGENITQQSARTILPSTAFDKYVYIFTKEGDENGVEKTPDSNGFFIMEIGNYNVGVQAFVGDTEPYTLAAIGVSEQFRVYSGNNAPVEVFLSSVDTSEKGKLNYTITYPADAAVEITLQKYPELTNIILAPVGVTQANGKTQILELDAGSYLFTILVNKGEFYAGKSEAVHIYSTITTVYTKYFNDNDLITYTPIRNAELIVSAPVKNAMPNTTASDGAVTGGGNFTISPVLWSPEHNSFLGGTVYTATVTLTANSRYTFNGLNSATINGQKATVLNNVGTSVTLSYTFPPTSERLATNIVIKTQPNKMSYTHGDQLDLSGLAVTITYDDATTEDVNAANFTSKNITSNPSNGNHLVRSTHNGQPVTITYGSLPPLTTDNLTVNPKVITFAVDDILSRTYTGNAITPTITVKDGSTTLVLTTDYTVEYADNINAGTATVTITGTGNYAGSTGSKTFNINKANGATVSTPILNASTSASISVNIISLDNGQTVEYSISTTNTVTNWQDSNIFSGLIGGTTYYISARSKEDANHFAGTASAKLQVTTPKGTGEVVGMPTLNASTPTSISVNIISLDNGQTVEYVKNTTNSVPSSGWQDSTIFSGLNPQTTYYIFARSKGNANFNTGTASESLTVTTLPKYTGATVSVPTLNSSTPNSISVNSITLGNGQTVEYARNSTNTAPSSGWQDSVTFNSLTASTTYYIFARSKSNAEYNTGTPSTGLQTTTPSKYTGATVSTPTLNSRTNSSITINAVTAPNNGQTVEYAINTTYSVPSMGWQDGTTFSGLTTGNYYYIYARSKENATYSAGAASSYLQAKVPTGNSQADAIPLTASVWTDGNVPTDGVQWFSFTATASTQYIHISNFDSYLYVGVRNSSGAMVEDRTFISYGGCISRNLTIGQIYYIEITPYSYSNGGTYKIAFNTTSIPPGTGAVTTLNANIWANGNVSDYEGQWFSFIATAATQYIHISSDTGYKYFGVHDSNGTMIGDRQLVAYGGGYISRNLIVGQVYYVGVTPYFGYGGTYRISFNASSTPPN